MTIPQLKVRRVIPTDKEESVSESAEAAVTFRALTEAGAEAREAEVGGDCRMSSRS